jgi:hypothetical protein
MTANAQRSAGCSCADKQTYEFAPSHSITSSAPDQRVGDVEAERLGGLRVDVHLNLIELLDRQGGRLVALEYPAGIIAGQAVCASVVTAP